jgi:pimeloyl-ACP methyl ester carboxylesterase
MEREPLLLVPGLLCTAAVFARQIAALAAERSVTVADHSRGESFAAMAAAILAEAPPRFAVAGLSMGGGIALQMVAQAPERISRLGLLGSSPLPDTPASSALRAELIALAENGDMPAVTERMLPLFLATAHTGDAGLRAAVSAMAEETGAELFIRHERAQTARPDARPLLPAIRCPTLVLVGDDDRLTPAPISRAMAAAIPDARLEIVRGAGHLSTIEAPLAVSAALAGWLVAP